MWYGKDFVESGWWRASVGLPESVGLKGASRDWRVSCGRGGERGVIARAPQSPLGLSITAYGGDETCFIFEMLIPC